jgi:hypothetical protein
VCGAKNFYNYLPPYDKARVLNSLGGILKFHCFFSIDNYRYKNGAPRLPDWALYRQSGHIFYREIHGTG